MSVRDHLMSDETVLDHCTTDYWAWICTDKRIIKYRSDGERTERLEEISLSEVSGISIVNTGKSDTLLGYTILSGIVSVLLLFFAFGTIAFPASLLVATVLIVPYGFYKRWKDSADGYFELKGTGLIQQEPKKWRIRSGGSPDDVQSFVKTIRDNI